MRNAAGLPAAGELEAEKRRLLGHFFQKLAHASRRLLMLDFDGTLAPFERERDRVQPYPAVAAAIEEIKKRGHTRLVIISGRDVHDLSARLAGQTIPELWGSFGRQRRKPEGVIETTPVEPKHLLALSDVYHWVEYQGLHGVAEEKPGSVAAHWRGLSPPRAEEIRARLLLGWNPIADRTGLQILDFDGGVEVRAPGPDKGDVVRILLAEEGPDVAAAYLGDDSSDEPAFRAIHHHGLSVLVRPELRETAAQAWIKPPEDVVAFLTTWLTACCNDDPLGGATSMAVNV